MSIMQRLYPDAGQAALCRRWCGHARYVWNLALHLVNHQVLQLKELDRFLAVRRQQGDWLAEGPSVVQQAALRDLRQAFTNRGKNPAHFNRPTRRKRGQHDGFKIRDLRIERVNRKWGRVLIPKTGWVKFRITRGFTDLQRATSARIKLHPDETWTISFVCPPPVFPRTATGNTVGVDLGCVNTIATSTGTFEHIPGLSAGETRRFLALQRKLDDQHRAGSPACFDELGRHKRTCCWRDRSHRSQRVQQKLGRLYQRLRNRRRDWIEQTTTRLVRDYDLIALEDLQLANMVRRPVPSFDEHGTPTANGARAKTRLAAALSASCLGRFRQRLTDKTDQATQPCTLVFVNPAYTSQECRNCHHRSPQNRETQAVFCCVNCGHTNHADTNAAESILYRATQQPNTVGGTRRRKDAGPVNNPDHRQPLAV